MIFGPGVDTVDAAEEAVRASPVRPSNSTPSTPQRRPCGLCLCGRSKAQRKLLGLWRRREANVSPVANAVFTRERADLVPQRISLLGAEVGAPLRIEPLVERQLLGPVLGEMLEEVLARSRAKEEEIGPDAGRAGFSGGPHDLSQLLGPVGDPRQ